MHILEKLFEDEPKIKMLRLFLFNPETAFGMSDITERLHITSHEAKNQLSVFSKVGLIRKKTFSKENNSSHVHGKEKIHGWTLNKGFPYTVPFQTFLLNLTPLDRSEIVHRLGRAGRTRLIVLSGVFLHEWDSSVDILIVGDHLKKGVIDSLIKSIESEISRELKYAIFETQDFNYRLGMSDKLVRNITDYPHETLLDRMEFEKK